MLRHANVSTTNIYVGLLARMLREIGHVQALFRYPLKSMAGEPLEVASLG